MHIVFKRTPPGRWLAQLWLAAALAVFAGAGRGGTIQVTNTADSGPGTLRQAIATANTNSGANTIVFQISGTAPFTIVLTNALPAITETVAIDATTQPGYTNKPVIELNGASAGSGTPGLKFTSGANLLRGLALNRFLAPAVELDGSSNVLQGNFFGTDVTGMTQRDNSAYAILVKSDGNLIGGTNSGQGNVISAGATANSAGIYLWASASNTIQGNLIGVNAAGKAAFSSTNNGVILYNAGNNLIGGAVAGAGNIISGNGLSGVYLYGAGSTGNVIQGNRIGTDVSGSNVVSNAGGDGISLVGAPGNVICSNLISGNGLAGVSIQGSGGGGNRVCGNFIGTDVTGKLALTNHNSGVSISGTGGNVIGGTNAGDANVISGNALDGITLTGGTATNLIQGNLIGVNAAGSGSLRNVQNGITISGSTANTIGGTVAAARNLISGNTNYGIDIMQAADTGNVIEGNYIGTDASGAAAVGNKLAGLLIQGCSNTIGGPAAGAGNVISGNGVQGLWLLGTNGNVRGNLVQGNFIGLSASGQSSLGNGDTSSGAAGIGISLASGNQIGGAAAGAGNVISANSGAGIFLVGSLAWGNVIQGNYIGTDPAGTRVLANGFEGIYLEKSGTNQIGGTAAGAGNLIAGNNFQGVFLTNSSWNVLQGNFIGTGPAGTNNLGNYEHNIELQANANNNVIGGTAAGAGNKLAYAQSVYCGVRVRTGAAGNLISANSIYSNGALGIDLSPTDGGASAGVNSIVDCESGVAASAANAGQNFPTLSNVYSGALTRVRGSFNSKSGRSYTLQFFASPAADSSGYGEGQVYLGQTNLTLGAACATNFTAYLQTTVSNGWVVTATAADASNNTSEFSDWVEVVPVPPMQLSRPGGNRLALAWTNNGGSFTLQQATNLTPPVTWAAVTNTPVLASNYMVTTLVLTNYSLFFRLTAP